MNLSPALNELRDERTSLKSRLRRVEAAIRTLEQFGTDGGIAPVRGELRTKILDVLRDSPERSWKPREVADVIGRSNIAVGQLLSTLRAEGLVEYNKQDGYRIQVIASVATAETPGDEFYHF